MATVVSTMQDIAAASKKIADSIGVIGGIAFQTNILALTAAVVAAHPPAQASKAAALRSWPAKCAAWPGARQMRPGRSSH